MSDFPDIPRPARNGNSAGAEAEHRYPCAECGAELRFAPGTSEVTCTHCGHVQTIDTGAVDATEAHRELDYAAAAASLSRDAEYEEHRSTACPGCGALVEFPESIQATRCPFCDTAVVAGTGSHRQIKPGGLIPFQLDERAARTAMTDWLGRLWFAPNGLRDYARKGRAMTGIYVPYWTFDAQAETDYRGQRGDHYYETRTVVRNGKHETVRVQKTRWSLARGHVSRFFDDVLVLASHSLPKSHTDALEPWDMSALVTYQPAYLSGFSAEGYQVQLEDGMREARAIMDRTIDSDIRRDIGGDVQRIDWKDTALSDVTFKHVLLPIWTAAYRYNNRTFRFVVNAQTGKVKGERPWSWIKITIAAVIALVLAGLIAWGISLSDSGNLSIEF
ncbi:MAG: primosomal protein N' (replication factor Y) - superfamily II helicase [Rubellimicrobium sp.]|nr:primosomal protein N' (replication factor Y) - superfamily II helicase [Rubellimicrobium sp.]